MACFRHNVVSCPRPPPPGLLGTLPCTVGRLPAWPVHSCQGPACPFLLTHLPTLPVPSLSPCPALCPTDVSLPFFSSPPCPLLLLALSYVPGFQPCQAQRPHSPTACASTQASPSPFLPVPRSQENQLQAQQWMQKLRDQLELQHFLRECHEVGTPAILDTVISFLGRELLQARGVVWAGTPCLSGSRSDVHSAPPGGAQNRASVRMLCRSLTRAYVIPGKKGGALAPLATARVLAFGSAGTRADLTFSSGGL